MILFPTHDVEQCGQVIEQWEPWLGSMLRLLTTIPVEVGDLANVDEVRRVCSIAREQASDLSQSLRKTILRMEDTESDLRDTLEQGLSGFLEGFDTSMLESLHMCALEFDLHRLSLGGSISGQLIPTVLPLTRLENQ